MACILQDIQSETKYKDSLSLGYVFTTKKGLSHVPGFWIHRMNLERLNFERLNFEQPNFERLYIPCIQPNIKRLSLERLNLDYDPTSDILNDESEPPTANLKILVSYVNMLTSFENFSVK